MLEALEDLRNDIARNCTPVALQHLPTEVADYFRDVVWPWNVAFLEAVDEELEEQAAVLEQLVENTEDAIHPETAAAIGSALECGAVLIHDLMKKIPPVDPEYPALQQRVAEYAARSTHALGLVTEATIEGPEADVEDADADDDDDDESDDDEDGGA